MLAYWVAMGALVTALLWAVADERRHALRWVVKPAASLLFIAAGWQAGLWALPWGRILFVGLLLAAVGDVLLIPRSRRSFLAGLVSFLLGHLAYGIAFGVRGLDAQWVAVSALVSLVVGVPVVQWLWPQREMRVPVAAYIVVITAMVVLAAGTVGAHGNPWLLVGACGFYLSDLAVAKDRFVGHAFANRAWGLPLYFFSQLALATAPVLAGSG